MKEKKRLTINIKRVIKVAIGSVMALILGVIVFAYSIGPEIRKQRYIRYTEAYFQALQEGDIQTASKYIGGEAISDVDGSRSEWIEKASKLRASNLTIEGIEELTYVDDEVCGHLSLIVVAKRGEEKEVFKETIFTDPSCAIMFDGLAVFYGPMNDMSRLEQDARFLIASDVTR